MSNSSQSYVANQPYNQTPEYQPPITVLDAAEYDRQKGQMCLHPRPFNLTISDYGCPQFLHKLATCPLLIPSCDQRHNVWQYNDRQHAQFILPFVMLGPAAVARDRNFIRENQLTMVISVRNAVVASRSPKLLDPARFDSCQGLETATFDIGSPFDFIQRVRPVIKLMVTHLNKYNQSVDLVRPEQVRGRILVCCETGNERSPVLVAAFLMLVYGLPWHESLNLIHAHRYSLAVSTQMNDMLINLGMIFSAQADLNASSQLSGRAKRSIDDMYDTEEDILVPEPEIRPGMAPFQDGG